MVASKLRFAVTFQENWNQVSPEPSGSKTKQVSWGEVSVSEVLLLTYTGEEVIRRADW